MDSENVRCRVLTGGLQLCPQMADAVKESKLFRLSNSFGGYHVLYVAVEGGPSLRYCPFCGGLIYVDCKAELVGKI